MVSYAENTSVSSEKSQQEIQRTLRRYGADQFMMGWDSTSAAVQFALKNRVIRFRLPMPDRQDKAFTHTPSKGLQRTLAQADEAYEQAIRQRWRALNLVIKAKMEAVESHITDFDSEFLAHIVMPNGMTMGEHIIPQMQRSLEGGELPQLLP
jgi:hypothetical protein